MRQFQKYFIKDITVFEAQILAWSSNFSRSCLLESNSWKEDYDCIVGVDKIDELISTTESFEQLKTFYEAKKALPYSPLKPV